MIRSSLLVGALIIAMTACSQTAQAGYTQPSSAFSEIDHTLAISAGGYVGGMEATAGGGIVFSEGGNIYRMGTGAAQPLYLSPQQVYSSWVVSAGPGGGYYFSNSSDYTVYSMAEDGSAVAALGVAAGSYDAAVDASGKLFLSRAKTFTGPTEIVMFDKATGTSTPVASFDGPCGPLVFGAAGDLYYATAASVFGQAGGQHLYRIASEQIEAVLSGGQVLTTAQLEVVVSDMDTASDMAFDGSGNLYLTTSVQAPSTILTLSGGALSTYATAADPWHYLTNLAWTGGSMVVAVGGVYGPGYDPTYAAFAELVPAVVREPGTAGALGSMLSMTVIRGLRLRRRGAAASGG